MVPLGAEIGVAQQALGVLVLLNAVVTSFSSMLARSSWLFGWIRGLIVKGGEAFAQIAQTDYTLFRHAGAIVEECASAQIAVVACDCVMLLVEWWKKRGGWIAGQSLLYLGPCDRHSATHVSGQADGRGRQRKPPLPASAGRQARR